MRHTAPSSLLAYDRVTQPVPGMSHSRSLRCRIAANNLQGTATSAIGNVKVLEGETTFAPILIRFMEALGPGRSAVDRLAQQGGRAVASLRTGARVVQLTGGRLGQLEGVVEFAVGHQLGIAGELGAEGSEPEVAVESGSKGLGGAVPHEDRPSLWQEKL